MKSLLIGLGVAAAFVRATDATSLSIGYSYGNSTSTTSNAIAVVPTCAANTIYVSVTYTETVTASVSPPALASSVSAAAVGGTGITTSGPTGAAHITTVTSIPTSVVSVEYASATTASSSGHVYSFAVVSGTTTWVSGISPSSGLIFITETTTVYISQATDTVVTRTDHGVTHTDTLTFVPPGFTSTIYTVTSAPGESSPVSGVTSTTSLTEFSTLLSTTTLTRSFYSGRASALGWNSSTSIGPSTTATTGVPSVTATIISSYLTADSDTTTVYSTTFITSTLTDQTTFWITAGTSSGSSSVVSPSGTAGAVSNSSMASARQTNSSVPASVSVSAETQPMPVSSNVTTRPIITATITGLSESVSSRPSTIVTTISGPAQSTSTGSPRITATITGSPQSDTVSASKLVSSPLLPPVNTTSGLYLTPSVRSATGVNSSAPYLGTTTPPYSTSTSTNVETVGGNGSTVSMAAISTTISPSDSGSSTSGFVATGSTPTSLGPFSYVPTSTSSNTYPPTPPQSSAIQPNATSIQPSASPSQTFTTTSQGISSTISLSNISFVTFTTSSGTNIPTTSGSITLGSASSTPSSVSISVTLSSALTSSTPSPPISLSISATFSATLSTPTLTTSNSVSSGTSSRSPVVNTTLAATTTAFPATTSASSTLSLGPSPTPSVCGEHGNFTITFDDLPSFSPTGRNDSDITQYPPVFSPYRHFAFSNGYVYAPPPAEPYQPASAPNVGVFLANGTGKLSSNPPGILPGEFGDVTGQDAISAFWFDAWGGFFGCDNPGPSDCELIITGYEYDNATEVEILGATFNATIPACPADNLQSDTCSLQQVTLPDTFRNLTGFRVQAVAGGQQRMWIMDSLRLGWSDNSCAAGLLRQRSR